MPVESRKANRSRNATRWKACESISKVVLPENLIRDDARGACYPMAVDAACRFDAKNIFLRQQLVVLGRKSPTRED
jgi:hypothetical protein